MTPTTDREADVAERFGRTLLALRERQELATYDLANQAGITAGMLAAYEAGKAWPPLPTLFLLLVALGCTLEDFGRHIGPWPPSVRRGGGSGVDPNP